MIIICAVSRRIFLLAGVFFVLVAAVGWSFARSSPGKSATKAGPAPAATVRPPAPVELTRGWRWLPDPHNLGVAEDWGQGGGADLPWQLVELPNDFNAGGPEAASAIPVAWYEVEFTGPPTTDGRGWDVAFESVRRNARVWLNGREIGSNADPYAPFSLPASSLMPGRRNVLVVRVDNIKGPAALPEDWWNWGGIMGPVTLVPVGRLKLSELAVMPALGCGFRCGELVVQGRLSSRGRGRLPAQIVVTVSSPHGGSWTARHGVAPVAPGAAVGVNFRVPVRRPVALWSPARPDLYRVQVDAVAGGRVEQTETLHVGMRRIEVRGGILYLNGRRVWLHGASIHEDVQDRGAALSDGDINTIVSELRVAGANITRAHYLLSPRLLDALDQAGIMVWSQPPVDHADAQLRSSAGRARAMALLRSTLIGARNHASVVIDSVGNELTPNPDRTPGTRAYLTRAIALARELNPGVPVALDTFCYPGYPAQRIYSKLDVLGISHYFGWYTGPAGHSVTDLSSLEPFLLQAHARYPKVALAISEFGAEALFEGQASIKGTYGFQSQYLEQTYRVLDRLPFMNGAIYWTLREFAVAPGWTGGVTLPPGLSPDGIHHKGLIAYDGTVKPAFTVAQRLFEQAPAFAR